MRTTGTVSGSNDSKGFGFITPKADGRIASSIIRPSSDRASRACGDKVEFDVVQGAKGPAAQNVVKLGR
jgi:CspA family cold shock protein